MQVPSVTIVKLPLKTVQIEGVCVLKVTGSVDEAVAESANGVELNTCVPGLEKLMVWLACPATFSVKLCGTEVEPAAVKVIVYGPPAVIDPAAVESVPVPEFAPPDVKETPAGKVPAVIVGVGLPVAVTAKVFAEVVLNVVLATLVKTGALLRLSVKLAVRGNSLGTTVTPQVPSASTAAIDTLLRLMT